jgi:hypothetical protein
MHTSRRLLLIAIVVVCASAMLAVPATGAAAYKTKVVVSLKFPAFHGKLVSPRQSCLAGRQVKMYRERNGRKVQLGRDTSNAKGKWAIPVGKNLTSGAYYAIVAKKGNCKGDKSGVVPID